MKYLRTIVWLFLLVTALQCSAPAQAGIDPGFDAVPVEIPDIQKTMPRPVTSMDLLTLRDIHGIQISPDGKYVAFVLGQSVYETNHYRTGMFVIGTEKNSKPVSLGNAGPPRWDDTNQWTIEHPVWSLDSRHFYHTMKRDGSWQVWRWDREGCAPVQVTYFPHNVQSLSLSPDGTKLVLTLETPSTVDKKKLAEQGILYDGSFDATGQSIIDRLLATPGGESETWVQDLGSGNAHRAAPEEQRELEVSSNAELTPNGELSSQFFPKKEIQEQKIYSFNMSPDRKKVAYGRTADDPSKSEWMTYPLLVKSTDKSAPITLTEWPSYPGLYWWSPDSKEIYYTEDSDRDPNGLDKTKIMATPANGGKPRLVLESDGFLFHYSADKSRRLLACVHETNASPPEVALADLSTEQLRTLVNVNPELQNLQINPAQRIDVFDKRGEHYWGHLVLPLGYEAGKRYPLIITTYADYGGFLRGGVGDEYPIHVFAANGFAVLNFNDGRVRTIKPGDFDRTMLRWQAPMEAIEAAVTQLSERGIVDSSRVGITGLSHGAELVNYGISQTSLFRVAIASGASWDPILFYLNDDQTRVETLPQFLNLESPGGASAPRWQKISAALNVNHMHAPLLINASDAEYIYAMQLAVSLRDRKKPFEMFIYPDERHEKNQPKHRYAIYERNVDWLNFWLRDEEDPNPAKAEQYKRWRELRALQEKDQQESATTKH